jgi:hypothetical protein
MLRRAFEGLLEENFQLIQSTLRLFESFAKSSFYRSFSQSF